MYVAVLFMDTSTFTKSPYIFLRIILQPSCIRGRAALFFSGTIRECEHACEYGYMDKSASEMIPGSGRKREPEEERVANRVPKLYRPLEYSR